MRSHVCQFWDPSFDFPSIKWRDVPRMSKTRDHFCRRYHYCVDPERQLLISPYTFLSSAAFSSEAVDSAYLFWSGSNYDKSPLMRLLEFGIQKRLEELPGQSPFLVQDRFAYISNRTGGTAHRPPSMTSFQNVLGIIFSGYSVGCSGFAELYSLGNLKLQCIPIAFKCMYFLQVCPFLPLPRSFFYPRMTTAAY